MQSESELPEESRQFYSFYTHDPTLQGSAKPCKISSLLRFANPFDKLMMAVGCFFSLANGFSLVLYAQPVKDLINAFDPHSSKEEVLNNVTFAIGAMAINSVLVFVNAAVMTVAWTVSSQRQLIRVRSYYFKSLLNQELAWFDRSRPEEVCSQMYVQTQRAQNAVVESITGILTSLSMGIGGIIYSFSRGWQMAAVMTGFLPIMLLANYFASRLNRKWQSKLNDQSAQIQADVLQVFENIKTVKYLEGEEFQTNRYRQKVAELSKLQVSLKRKTTITGAITFFCIIFNYALGFWYGSKLVADQTYNPGSGKPYSVGDVVSIFFVIYLANLNLSNFSHNLANFYNCRLALARIIAIVDRSPRQSNGTQTCLTRINSIVFQNVIFNFSRPLFRNFNLTLNRGIIAIIGSSGNGKSTLLNLIMKFYEPFIGEIFLKQKQVYQNLKDVNATSLRERIGYVGQEPVLLGKTIRTVLQYKNVNEQQMWDALDLSCATEFVQAIGLDCDFKALSGGQKQRIAIARAILRAPEILILDEGTSALDRINERNILKNLKERSKIGFIIMVAHRFQTLAEADCIIKIQNGEPEIVQQQQSSIILETIQHLDEEVEEKVSLIQQKNAREQSILTEQSIKKDEETKEQAKQQQKMNKFKLKYLWQLLRMNSEHYRNYIYGLTATAITGCVFPAFSYIITQLCSVVTEIQYAKNQQQLQEMRDKASSISIWLIIISCITLVLDISKGFCLLELTESLGLKLKSSAFAALLKFQMTEVDKRGKRNLAHLVNAHCDGAKNMASGILISFSDTLATMGCGLAIAFVYCWQITLISLFLIPFSLIAGRMQHRFLNSLGQNSDKVHRKTHELVVESIIHSRTVKSLNLEEKYYKTYVQQQKNGFKKSLRNSICSGVALGISQCLISLLLSVIYFIGAKLVESDSVQIVNLFTAIYAIMFSGVQAGCNIGFVGSLAGSGLATAQYFALVDPSHRQESATQIYPQKNISHNKLIEQFQADYIPDKSSHDRNSGAIQFRNVHFKYPSRRDYLFQGLSFRIKSKERVAIVGQSGTGKTTIADLLLKIYRPDEGEILLDDVNIVFFSRLELAHKFSIVSQQPALFNRSVTDNIKYNSVASVYQIEQAAKLASAYDFIDNGNFGVSQLGGSGWQKEVGSRGSLLSGGQKQRVAVARALVRKPTVLVLDEATSALDKQTEQTLLKNINKKLEITQIVIAHRLSTIRSCDRIIVLKQGKLVQTGTYDDLLRAGGEFARLAQTSEKQDKNFKPE